MSSADAFNQSGVSRFLNSQAGRVFRLVAGAGFLIVGYLFRDRPLGVISMVYSILPLSAGAFDICFVSAVLGGPLSGAKIREAQHQQPHGAAPNPKQPQRYFSLRTREAGEGADVTTVAKKRFPPEASDEKVQ